MSSIQILSESRKLELGRSNGFAVIFDDLDFTGDAIQVSPGYFEANGKIYYLATSTRYRLTSLASGFDYHYIYIDDSASSAPVPTFIDSTTEPAFNPEKGGWYNGDDRLVGVIESPAASATIQAFGVDIRSDNRIRNIGSRTLLANSITMDGTWRTPNTINTDALTPVNAAEAFIQFKAFDDSATSTMAWRNEEDAAVLPDPITCTNYFAVDGYPTNGMFRIGSWGPLKRSRKIKVAGTSIADYQALILGWGYSR